MATVCLQSYCKVMTYQFKKPPRNIIVRCVPEARLNKEATTSRQVTTPYPFTIGSLSIVHCEAYESALIYFDLIILIVKKSRSEVLKRASEVTSKGNIKSG
jgi:hypothetical protein